MCNEYCVCGFKYDMMIDYYIDVDQFFWNKDVVFYNYGVFGELIWFVVECDWLIGGLCLDCVLVKDYWQILKFGYMGYVMVNLMVNDICVDILFSGFVCYEYDFVDLLIIFYVGFGYVECFFDYWELFLFKCGLNGLVNVFDKIKLEKIIQFDFGFQYNGDKLQVWVFGYVGVVQDFILFSYCEGMMGFLIQVINVDVWIMGGELGVFYQFIGNWKIDVSLVYVWGKNSFDDCVLLQILLLEVCFGLIYEEGDWSVGSLWWVVVLQNCIVRDQGNVVGKDFDKSVGFGVFLFNGVYWVICNVKLSVGVDNLFDKDYIEYLNKVGDVGFGFFVNEMVFELGWIFWIKVDFSF